MLWNITKGVGGEILLRPVIVSSLKISYFRLLVYFIAFELNVIVHLDIFLSELDQKKKKTIFMLLLHVFTRNRIRLFIFEKFDYSYQNITLMLI